MKKALFALSIISALVSCKKSETTPVASCSTTNASIAGLYKITAISYKASASSTAQDWYANWPDCQKDDTYELKADGSVAVTDAGASCGMPPGPGGNSAWVLENNNSTLRMSDIPFTIVSFNCATLVVSEADVSTAGDSKTTTYVKQ